MNILEDIRNNKLFWLASILGLLGTILNAYQSVYGFVFWMISNPILMYQAYDTGNWNIGLMFFLYFGLAVVGFLQWSGW